MGFLTRREIEVILGWKERVDWPDEKRVLVKLERALETPEKLRLSAVQIGIIRVWAEEQVVGRFGSVVMNPEEQAILRKLSEEPA